MNLRSLNIKLILGTVYLVLFILATTFLLTNYDVSDFFSYEFIRENKDIILKYKNKDFLVLTFAFVIFSIVWVLFLGFAIPLLIFSGFVFGKWWGILIVVTSTTIGATLLYFLAGLFLHDIIQEKFAPKYSKLKKFFNKNELIYFMFFRFIGGGGMPYVVQNILPILFNISLKNYFIATFLGTIPSMFVTVSFGSGIENVIDKNEEFKMTNFIFSPEIYFPIIGFFILILLAFVFRKIFFIK